MTPGPRTDLSHHGTHSLQLFEKEYCALIEIGYIGNESIRAFAQRFCVEPALH